VLLCEACNGGHHEDQILLCDGCDRGFHMFCLNPPLEKIPAGDWLCPICLQAKSDNSALRQGTEMSWGEFEKSANAAKRMYWGGDARARKVGFARTPPYSDCVGSGSQRFLMHIISFTIVLTPCVCICIVAEVCLTAGTAWLL
jgi:histone demethylase JARID1